MSDELSESEIEDQLRAARDEITDTLNQLVEQVDPREAVKRQKQQVQAAAADLGDQAMDKVADVQQQAQRTIEDAQAGDNKARGIVAGVGAGALLVGGLIIRKIIK